MDVYREERVHTHVNSKFLLPVIGKVYSYLKKKETSRPDHISGVWNQPLPVTIQNRQGTPRGGGHPFIGVFHPSTPEEIVPTVDQSILHGSPQLPGLVHRAQHEHK